MINERKSGLHVTVTGSLQICKPTLSIPRTIPDFIKRQSKEFTGEKNPQNTTKTITLQSQFLMHQYSFSKLRNPSAPLPVLCSPEVWSTWREEQAGKYKETAGSQPAEDGADGAV